MCYGATPHTTRPNDEKLREMILLISERRQADPKFGAIKLNKLLFHADFSAFLTHGEPIAGKEYLKLPQGPAPSPSKGHHRANEKEGRLSMARGPILRTNAEKTNRPAYRRHFEIPWAEHRVAPSDR